MFLQFLACLVSKVCWILWQAFITLTPQDRENVTVCNTHFTVMAFATRLAGNFRKYSCLVHSVFVVFFS